MSPVEKFRESLQHALTTASASGTGHDQLHAVLLEIAGLDRTAARDAAENLDQLIDGEQDDLADQLGPARAIRRQIAGS